MSDIEIYGTNDDLVEVSGFGVYEDEEYPGEDVSLLVDGKLVVRLRYNPPLGVDVWSAEIYKLNESVEIPSNWDVHLTFDNYSTLVRINVPEPVSVVQIKI